LSSYAPAVPLPEDVEALFAGPNYAHLALVLPSGTPHTSVIWAGVEDGAVVFFTTNETRIRNLARDPRVALSVTDHENPYRSAWVRGRIARRIDGDEALTIIDRLSQKYTGADFPMRAGTVFVVESERARAVELPFEHRPA
jgi:PPOX class probable F420-dependent enzyme